MCMYSYTHTYTHTYVESVVEREIVCKRQDARARQREADRTGTWGPDTQILKRHDIARVLKRHHTVTYLVQTHKAAKAMMSFEASKPRHHKVTVHGSDF
jgi:hypothetical protein